MIVQANLSGIQAFCLTYELGNFTEAAKSLDVTPQAVSRAVGRLEQDLGVSLFRRNTRQLNATEEGRIYYESARNALQALLDAEQALHPSAKANIQGTVKLSVPSSFAQHRLAHWMLDLQKRLPEVKLDLKISNQNKDFVEQGFDLAIQEGDVRKKANVTQRKLGDFSLGVFVAPSYIKAHGEPQLPMELEQHHCVLSSRVGSTKVLPWTFSPSPDVLIPPSSILIHDDLQTMIALAKAGAGFIQTYHFLVETDLKAGRLVEVLRPYGGCTRSFSLLYTSDTKDKPAVQAVIDVLMEKSLQDPRH